MGKFQAGQTGLLRKNRQFCHAHARRCRNVRFVRALQAHQAVARDDHKTAQTLVRCKDVRSRAQKRRTHAECAHCTQQVRKLPDRVREGHDLGRTADAKRRMMRQ